jgi:hypothetical protein
MKRFSWLVWIALVMAAVALASSPAAGQWQGRVNHMPAVTLKVGDDAGKLSGTAIFFVVKDQGSGPQVIGQLQVPMLNPRFDGRALLFEINQDRPNSPPGAARAVVRFKMKLLGSDEGELVKAGETSGVRMKRVR